jgi:hypothetical protein
MFRSVYCVYCLCVNVYRTAATGCLPNCSHIYVYIYHYHQPEHVVLNYLVHVLLLVIHFFVPVRRNIYQNYEFFEARIHGRAVWSVVLCSYYCNLTD